MAFAVIQQDGSTSSATPQNNLFPAPVTFNMTEPIYADSFRTFKHEDIVAMVNNKVPKAIKRKPISGYWEFVLINNTGFDQTVLNIQFKNDVEYSRGLTAEPFTSVSGDTKKKFKFVGATIPHGGSVTIKGYSKLGKPQQIKKAYFSLREPKPNPAVNINPNFEYLELPMPTYANLIEEVYADMEDSFVVGKVREDSAKKYGWVRLVKPADVQKSLRDGTGIHDAPERFFDFFDGSTPKKLFNGQQKSLPPKKHDNRLFAEIVALKLAIASSRTQHTKWGFGELYYNNNENELHGKQVKEIASLASEAMTMKTGNATNFYTVIRAINETFAGPIDTVSFGLPLPNGKTVITGIINTTQTILVVDPLAPKPLENFRNNKYDEEPDVFQLSQNYPNPFNPSTTISIALLQDAIVTLKVYNSLGQEIAVLADNELLSVGTREFVFEARTLPSGVYFYRIVAEGIEEDALTSFTQVKKMILMK